MTYIQNFAQPPGETSHCYALFLDGSGSCPAVRLASSAPEATRRCIGRLGTPTPPWLSSWSLRGPRWTGPTTAAVAPEGFSGRFGSGSDQVMEGVRTLAGDFLLCFGNLWDVEWCLVLKDPYVSLCHLSLELGLASWNSRKRNDRTWRGKQHDWKPEASMLSQNVQWLEVSCDLDLDPSLTSNWNKLKRLQELGTTRCFKSILNSTSFFLLEWTIVINLFFVSFRHVSMRIYRGLSWFHCAWHETVYIYMRHMMLRK